MVTRALTRTGASNSQNHLTDAAKLKCAHAGCIVILPLSSFQEYARNISEKCHDEVITVVIIRKADLFLTRTCNRKCRRFEVICSLDRRQGSLLNWQRLPSAWNSNSCEWCDEESSVWSSENLCLHYRVPSVDYHFHIISVSWKILLRSTPQKKVINTRVTN